jgi:AcrR family transcriptional regulator
MARWAPGAEDRLRHAALDLFLERGFEAVTATDIAERAGLARRTFFRYFADKREVLFGGSEQLVDAVTEAVRAADTSLAPFETVLDALARVGIQLADIAERASDRRRVIAASAELQERERTKMAAVTAALTDALGERGVDRGHALVLAQVGVALFGGAFARWADSAGALDFATTFRDAVAELRRSIADR